MGEFTPSASVTVPTIVGLPLTRPIAAQVTGSNTTQLTKYQSMAVESEHSKWNRQWSRRFAPAHGSALIDGEAGNRFSREGRVQNAPGRAAVARFQESRSSAGVADCGRWARDSGDAGHAGRRSRIGPDGTSVIGDDDGGQLPAVVSDGDAGRCARRRARCAGDGIDVGQRAVAGGGLPMGAHGAGRRWS